MVGADLWLKKHEAGYDRNATAETEPTLEIDMSDSSNQAISPVSFYIYVGLCIFGTLLYYFATLIVIKLIYTSTSTLHHIVLSVYSGI